jgi:hypothetical protein
MNKFLHFNVPLNPKAPTALRKRYQSRTVAAEQPKFDIVWALAQAFLSQATGELFAHINVGVTFLSLKDRYNRKTGREESVKRQKLEKLRVIGVELTPTHIFVRLETFKGVGMSLRTHKESKFTTVCGCLVSEHGNPLEI